MFENFKKTIHKFDIATENPYQRKERLRREKMSKKQIGAEITRGFFG
jgi:hypothetical protein